MVGKKTTGKHKIIFGGLFSDTHGLWLLKVADKMAYRMEFMGSTVETSERTSFR